MAGTLVVAGGAYGVTEVRRPTVLLRLPCLEDRRDRFHSGNGPVRLLALGSLEEHPWAFHGAGGYA